MITFPVPNLDGQSSPAELRDFATVVHLLACYADHKGRAMELRAQGDIECALSFERSCERIYGDLPSWTKW